MPIAVVPTDEQARARAARIAPYVYGQAALTGLLLGPLLALCVFVHNFAQAALANADPWANAQGAAIGLLIVGLAFGPGFAMLLLWILRWQGDTRTYPALRQAQRAKDVPMLLAAIASDREPVRRAAAQALTQLALVQVLPQRAPADRDAAASSLIPTVAATLLQQGERGSETTIGWFSGLLSAMADVVPAAVVPELYQGLAGPHTSVRAAACTVLGRCGASAKPALPLLTRARQDSEPSVRQAALAALHAPSEP